MSTCVLEEKKCYAPSVTESIYSSKSTCNLQRRKIISTVVGKNKNNISDIILSAREKRVKHLRSQLTDANLTLAELLKENNILKCIKKRHESALQKYENINGDIPKLMNNQTEEIRVWQIKYKELKKRYRESSQTLNKKQIQYNKLSEEYEYLSELTKQENLGELDDMQNQLKVLKEKFEKQQQTIECLKRRLVLDEKAHAQVLEKEKKRNMTSHQSASSNETINQNEKTIVLAPIQEKLPQIDGIKHTKHSLIERKKINFKSIMTGTISRISSHQHSTIIPKLNIPIPETDNEDSASSEDEKSYRTRTLSRRSESYYVSDFEAGSDT